MSPSWASFEDKVRSAAGYIYNSRCERKNIGGVDIDGVIILSSDVQIFIEMTERRELDKIREDINKLNLARSAYLAQFQSFPRCYCVIDGSITKAMKDAGSALNIKVMSYDEFSSIFFDFEKYRFSRSAAAFSSAINPLTGEKDERGYIEVSYLRDGTSKQVSISEISEMLRKGRKIILLGEYGTGKSRCARELFAHLSENAHTLNLYPLALDLRDFWGLRRATEIITRHLSELGLDATLQSAAIRALNAERVILLLDGFDELGSQAWSNDGEKLRSIRAKSLEGVKELLLKNKNGALISGREHYFNNNEEMLNALGLSSSDVVILRCKNEFTLEEMRSFFDKYIANDIEMPSWLPRRPLVCQTIADLTEDELDQMLGVGQDEIGFFDHFIKVLCSRDKRINTSFDASTIERVLTFLARITRTRTANVGPITLNDVQMAFEEVVGQLPVEEASLMLQRLPALGRVKAETNDRQFIDSYILDGLRAKDTSLLIEGGRTTARAIATSYTNPLDELGLRLLARSISHQPRKALDLAKKSSSETNQVLASDIVAAFVYADLPSPVDFDGIVIRDGHFIRLDLTSAQVSNLTIIESVFGTIYLPSSAPKNTFIRNSLAEKVVGVSSPTGLPQWIEGLHADKFDSTESIARIRQIGLSPAQEILITIIRKTFFQKGAGRKEEALLRGLGQATEKRTAGKIINLLLSNDVLTSFKGSEGPVYAPNRKHAGRMRALLYELKTSQDPIWGEVSEM